MGDRAERRLLFGLCLFLLFGAFFVVALDSDRLNRRIAALECRAGETEKCGPPWSE